MRSKNRQTDEAENRLHVSFHWTKFVPVLLVFAGLGQFMFGISAAVSYYPSRFSFQHDFLSELGQTRVSESSISLSSTASLCFEPRRRIISETDLRVGKVLPARETVLPLLPVGKEMHHQTDNACSPWSRFPRA